MFTRYYKPKISRPNLRNLDINHSFFTFILVICYKPKNTSICRNITESYNLTKFFNLSAHTNSTTNSFELNVLEIFKKP